MNFIPEMSTAKVDETTITRVQAMVGGNIVQGSSTIDEQGILYSTASSEYFTDTVKVTSLDSDGNFTVLLQGLEPGKTYYYCTYVKSGPTLARANVETFTTNENPKNGIAVTGQVDTYGITYAVVGGSVNLDLLPAGAGNPEIGVEYSYVASDGTTKSLQKQIDSLTDNAFNVELSNLSPATECKYRSYVRYGGITYYGEYRTFTTKSLVNITIPGEATDISLNSAKVTSNVDADKLDKKDSLTVGIAYSTSASLQSEGTLFSETIFVKDVVDGIYTVTMSGLLESTVYYYASFTEIDGCYCFSETKTFTTLSEADLAITGQVKDYGMTFAEISGSINMDLLPEGSGNPEVGIEICGSSSEGTENPLQKKAEVITNNIFTVSFCDLLPSTEYKYRSFAKCKGRVYYGKYASFRTMDLENVAISGQAVDISYNFATITSTIKTDEFDERENLFVGIAYSTSASLQSEGTLYSEKFSVKDLAGGMFTVELNDLSDNTVYYYASFTEVKGVYVFSETKSFSTRERLVSEIEAVDLGLSVKWADCNVGASSPEDFGGYYAWGEVEGKSDYSWKTYKWCNGSNDTMTKYCTYSSNGVVDNKIVLESKDDVAQVEWGGDWRMPTYLEMKELKDKCSWTWSSIKGVNGYVVTGPSGNSIFLPAAGDCNGTGLNGSRSNGYYWTAMLQWNNICYSYSLYFHSGNVYLDGNLRYSGHSIRPVKE